MSELQENQYAERVKSFSLWAIFIMLVMVYNYDDEIGAYMRTFEERYYANDTHGQNAVTYVSKNHWFTCFFLFTANFSIFMFYF